MKRTIAVAVLLGATCTAQADLVVSLKSEKGDYIGQGLTQTLTYLPANSTATLSSQGDINISGTGGPHSFNIELSPLKGATVAKLLPGLCYDRATRAPFRDNNRPGIDASMDSRGCNDSMGRFHILELTTNGTQVLTLAVDFAQSCNQDGGNALFGNIRFNSALAATTPFIDHVYTASGSLHFNAIGSGIGSSAPGKTATIALTRPLLLANRNFDNGVSMSYNGPLPGLMTDGRWALDFAAADSAVLAVGSYVGAMRYPFQTAGKPGLDFTYNGSGSNMVTGSFNLSSVNYEPYDLLPQDFVGSFVHNSEGNTANQTNGTITYHAVFHNGGIGDEIFPSGFESGQTAPSAQSLAYPCSG
jgi:hypothetical protein